MSSSSVMHSSLSGARVRITAGSGVDLTQPATSISVFAIDGVEREFTAGLRRLGREVAASFGVPLTDSLRYQDGTFLTGAKENRWAHPQDGYVFHELHRVAVWEGAEHSLHTHVFHGTVEDALDIFDCFQITERPDGVVLVPRGPRAKPSPREPMLLKELPEVGLLQIRALTAEQARSLPRWSGTAVQGGDVYCHKADQRPYSFALVSQSAATLVMTDVMPDVAGDEGARRVERQVLPGLSTLEVSWEADAG